jgi:hypothetical protein
MKVAQIANLLFRRLPVGKPREFSNARRLAIGDTTGWQPALHAPGGAR